MPIHFSDVRRLFGFKDTGAAEPEPKAEPLPITVKPVDGVDRERVLKESAKKAVEVVSRTKDVDGALAMEGFGKGDPRASERRSALSLLLADKTGTLVDLDGLRQVSTFVAKDIDFLKAEAREYTAHGPGQFQWNDEKHFDAAVAPSLLQSEFDERVRKQEKVAGDFASGKTSYLDVSSTDLVGLAFLAQRDRRCQGMVDALWQLRARTDQANQKEGSWNFDRSRIDRVGIAIVAGERVFLAGAELGLDEAGMREYALARELVASHPIGSTNTIFVARNAISALLTDQGRFDRDDSANPMKWVVDPTSIPPGANTAPYRTIHWNYSRDTPKNIEAFMQEWMFPVGPRESRGATFCGLVAAMRVARAGNVAGARDLLARVGKESAEAADIVAKLTVPDDKLAESLVDTLKGLCVKTLGTHVEKNLECAARTYESICAGKPDASWLEHELLRARGARDAVASVLVAMERGDDVGTLRELGNARLAVRDAVLASKLGTERLDLLRFDAQLGRLANEQLGGAVESVGKLATPAERGTALIALQSALRGAVASGLYAVKEPNDPKADVTALPEALAKVDALVALAESGAPVPLDQYRAVMSQAHRAVTRTVQNLRACFQARQMAVASGGANLDPEFVDQFIKQSPLHYATALAEKGLRVGLVQKIGPRCIENVDGMRVLNSVGPVVFSGVVVGESTKAILETEHARDALAVVYHLDEKKMVAGIGGLVVDTENAPGGNSHLNMYAMNNGIPVVALPELRTAYAQLVANAQKEGGIYIDDSDGSFRMMTVGYALEKGFIKPKSKSAEDVRLALEALRPGNNRHIKYLAPAAAGDGFDLLDEHTAQISPQRLTREVEIFVPADEVQGVGKKCVAFRDLAKLGIKARHLAGEKGTVLALLKAHPEIGKYVPDGSTITTGRIRRVLSEITLTKREVAARLGPDVTRAWGVDDGATLASLWDAVWQRDPAVGQITEQNFTRTRLFTDSSYRKSVRETLQALTLEKVTGFLVTTDAQGQEKLTPAGEELYHELLANKSPADPPRPDQGLGASWILRSSFTGEDRPGTSGAGQYESIVDMKVAKQMVAEGKAASVAEALPVARMKAFAGVLESTWMPEPVENNVSEQFFLNYIYPSCTVQSCLSPEFSGVMISRDTEHGGPGVTFQLVPGFGGGVEGGKTTEGVVTPGGFRVKITNGEAGKVGSEAGKVQVGDHQIPASAMAELHKIVTSVERYFNEVVEKDKGHAVDMEMAFQDGQWWIVQARVILVDR